MGSALARIEKVLCTVMALAVSTAEGTLAPLKTVVVIQAEQSVRSLATKTGFRAQVSTKKSCTVVISTGVVDADTVSTRWTEISAGRSTELCLR